MTVTDVLTLKAWLPKFCAMEYCYFHVDVLGAIWVDIPEPVRSSYRNLEYMLVNSEITFR